MLFKLSPVKTHFFIRHTDNIIEQLILYIKSMLILLNMSPHTERIGVITIDKVSVVVKI